MPASPLNPTASTAVLAIARAWIGTPYLHQASVQGVGCDCLGLARGIWRALHGQEPWEVPPYSRDWGEAGRREVLAETARAALIEIPYEAGLLHGLRLGAVTAGAFAAVCCSFRMLFTSNLLRFSLCRTQQRPIGFVAANLLLARGYIRRLRIHARTIHLYARSKGETNWNIEAINLSS